MEVDNSIITKFELTDKEKRLKANFFNSKPQKLQNLTDNPNATDDPSAIQKNINNISDEQMNKFLADNTNLMNYPLGQNVNNGMNQQQLNLIYTQNKLMERNVDVLQETQRNMHDFIIYNMRKDAKNEQKSKESNSSNVNLTNENINKILSPIYQSVNELKNEIKAMSTNLNKNNLNMNSNNINTMDINNKLNDVIEYSNQVKGTNSNYSNNINLLNRKAAIEAKKENPKTTKELNELKNTLGNITTKMNNMEDQFNEMLNKDKEEKEKMKLNNLVSGNTTKNNSINPFSNNLTKRTSLIKDKILDEMDYNEFKNEILDINTLQNEIIKDYKKNTPSLPDLEKPKNKIKFDYNVDYPSDVSTSYHSKKNIQNVNNVYSSSFTELDKSKNVFNQNLANNEKRPSNNISRVDNNYPQNNFINLNMPNQNQQKQYIDNAPKYKYNEPTVIKKDYSNMNIADKMNDFKEKMLQNKSNIETTTTNYLKNQNLNQKKQIKEPRSLNPFTNEVNPGAGSRITFQQMKKEYRPKPVEKEINPIPKEKPKIKYGQIDVPVREEVTSIQVKPNEKKDRKQVEENLLRLCVSKYLQKDQIIPAHVPIDDGQRKRVEGCVMEYIRNALRNVPKPPENQFKFIKEESSKINISEPKKEPDEINTDVNKPDLAICDRERITIQQKEIHIKEQNDNKGQYEELLKSLIKRCSGIEEAISNLNLKANEDTRVNKTDINIRGGQMPYGFFPMPFPYPPPQPPVPPKTNINQQGREHEQSQIFEDTNKIDISELDKEIKMPHKINLNEYEISASSSYISDARNMENSLYNTNIKNKIVINNDNSLSVSQSNSISQGQIIDDDTYLRRGLNIENLNNELNPNVNVENNINQDAYYNNNIGNIPIQNFGSNLIDDGNNVIQNQVSNNISNNINAGNIGSNTYNMSLNNLNNMNINSNVNMNYKINAKSEVYRGMQGSGSLQKSSSFENDSSMDFANSGMYNANAGAPGQFNKNQINQGKYVQVGMAGNNNYGIKNQINIQGMGNNKQSVSVSNSNINSKVIRKGEREYSDGEIRSDEEELYDSHYKNQ